MTHTTPGPNEYSQRASIATGVVEILSSDKLVDPDVNNV